VGIDIVLLHCYEVPYTTEEISAIRGFYENGGSLFIVGAPLAAADGGAALRQLLQPDGIDFADSITNADLDLIYQHWITSGVDAALPTGTGFAAVIGGEPLAAGAGRAVVGAVAAEHTNGGRLVFVSAADFVTDGVSDTNTDVFVGNTVNWLLWRGPFMLGLRREWNLISVPVNDPARATSALLDSEYVEPPVWQWTGSSYEMVGEVLPQQGYWVYCELPARAAEVTVELPGDPVHDGTTTLCAGWSLTGPAWDCIAPDNAAIQYIWRWDPDTQRYRNEAADAVLCPGSGYWFLASEECEVHLGGRAER
jgi:hypothetical protein